MMPAKPRGKALMQKRFKGDLVCHTPLDENRHRPTGHYVEGLMPEAAGLAICKSGAGFCLFYCDKEWNILNDTWYETVEEAQAEAATGYAGLGRHWQTA